MDAAAMLESWSTWVGAEATLPQSSTGPWDVNIPGWVVGAGQSRSRTVSAWWDPFLRDPDGLVSFLSVGTSAGTY